MLERLRSTYMSLVPYRLRPKQLWYRFKCWAWHRYSTVRVRALPHTWVDRCELMPQVMFQILSDFIEKECSPGHVEWYGEYSHTITVGGKVVNVRDEMQNLYDWWHNDYLKNRDKCYDLYFDFCDKHMKRDEIEHESEEHGTLFEWVEVWDTPENEEIGEVMWEAARKREVQYVEELNTRLHRLVNVIPYMWT